MKTSNLTTAAFSLVLGVSLFSCQKTTPPSQRKPPVVTAGASQTITLPSDSVTLNGWATDSSSTIVAYLWSEVSGPNVPVIEDEGSKTTGVTGLTGGTYIFQLMATDSFGLTGVNTVQITVNGPSKNSITISPLHNPYEIEFIGSTQLNYSEGQYPQELGAEEWTINGVQVGVRSVVKFDLSSVTNTNFTSAQLSLYSNPTPFTANLETPNYGTSNAFYIQRVNENWDPTTETWLTQPTTDSTAEVLVPQTNLSTLDLPNIDVTQLVKNMLSSGNYGFEMRLQNEVIYNSRIFCSSSYSDSTKRPVLTINY